MVSLLDKFMLTFVEEAESSTDMINHPSQHEIGRASCRERV